MERGTSGSGMLRMLLWAVGCKFEDLDTGCAEMVLTQSWVGLYAVSSIGIYGPY